MVREQMVECLSHARGGTHEEHERYLEDVLQRAGANGTAAWPHLYRALTIMRDDSLANGADPQRVQDHITKLHQILEEVED